MGYELIRAIRAGDSASVRRLLQKGLDPNFQMPAESDHGHFLDRVTPLMVAVATPKATAEIVGMLLAHGADPFAVSAGKVSSTWYACGGGTGYPLTKANLQKLELDHTFKLWGGGDEQRLKLVLEAGGNPNECAANGRSCLYEACSVGDPARLRLLIERGAQVVPARTSASTSKTISEARGKKVNETLREEIAGFINRLVPLFAASSAGSLDCVQLIVESGFPADFDLDGDNALNKVGNVEVADYLWNQGVRPRAGRFGFDALDDAIDSDDLSVLRFLLTKADLATIQKKLLVASGGRMNPRAVRLMLDLGADANKPDKDYGSPLHYVCWQGDGNLGRGNDVVEQTIQTLIVAGADPNLVSRGTRPLHEAVFGDWGSPTSVRVLICHGAVVDALDEHGQTALMIAAQHGEFECVRLLLEAGANRALKDQRGKTALDYAEAHLEIWKKPRFTFFNRGMDKIFRPIELNTDDVSDTALVEAQNVVDLLSR